MKLKPQKQNKHAKQSSIYCLKIRLINLEPAIWRRFAVSSDIKLSELHEVIQITMGWMGRHLHEFVIDDSSYMMPDPDDPFGDPKSNDEREAILSKVVRTPDRRFIYMYDFGDDWEHELIVEKIAPPESGVKYPVCLGGERSCPPEDCGGPPGYMEFLEAILSPTHERHSEFVGWIGGSFDSEEFDLNQVNDELEYLVKHGMRRWDDDLLC